MKRSAGVVLALLLSGCALMRKGAPLPVRYFVPEPELAQHDAQPLRASAEPPVRVVKLRLGRVSSGPQLGQRIVERLPFGEVRFHDTLRWTERPEAYLRRDLAAALFERGGLTRVAAGPGPTLDVELVAFEERSGTEPHEAHFRAVLSLYGERELLLEKTVSETVPLEARDEPARIRAFSTALARGVASVAQATRAALHESTGTEPDRGARAVEDAAAP